MSPVTDHRRSPTSSRRRSNVAGLAGLSALAVATAGATGCASASDPLKAPATAPKKSPTITLLPNDPPVPVLVAAGDGHVVAVAVMNGNTRLFEITGGKQRLIAAVKGAQATPSVGTDAAGNAVVVLQPCVSRKLSHCRLRSYDIATGASKAISGSEGAALGDMDHGQIVFAKPVAGPDGTLVTFSKSNASRAKRVTLPLTAVLKARGGAGNFPATPFATSIDLLDGVVAATVEYGGGGGASLLLRGQPGRERAGSAPWTLLARSSYGEASGIPRVYRAATVTPSGVRAFYDGGDNDAGFVGRWSAKGRLVTKLSLAGTGVELIDDNAAFDGNRLVVARAYDFSCASDPNDPSDPVRSCPVLSTGPFPLG